LTREHNWADSYTFKAARIHRPRSVDDIRRLVAGASKVRAIGARHSFNGIGDSSGVLIDLRSLEPDIIIDPQLQTVAVGAGATYGALATYLQARGWALHNMASLSHISIAGATGTGTHGSGDKNGNLSTAVAVLELVTANGDLIQVRRGDAGFDAMVVGLGAFGIVTRVTLDIQPSFQVRQDAFVDLPWARVLASLDEIMAAAYSVSILTRWSGTAVDRLWLKTRLVDGDSPSIATAHLGLTSTLHPDITDSDESLFGRLTLFGMPGPWSERLPHVQSGGEPGITDQIQSEYMVPRAAAISALVQLRKIGERIDNHLRATEIRTIKGDDLWLSPSYGHDTLAIHFTWKNPPGPVLAVTSEIEDILLPLGARPHWGKLMHARADKIARLYARLPDFQNLVRTHDPHGKFRNEFLDTHVLA